MTYNSITLLCVLSILFLSNCSSRTNEQKVNIAPIVQDYYKVYQDRNDFQRFLAFYDDNIVLEDIILGEKMEGMLAFKRFFDWGNPNFSKTDSLTLIIKDQIIKGNTAVTSGYFTPFIWGDTTFEAMYFNTILTFNAGGKIQKQVDWINYPNGLVDYNKRKNSNQWILDQEK